MAKGLFSKYMVSHDKSEQVRYLPQSVKLEEAINPHMVRFTMMAISLVFLSFIAWSGFVEINEVASARGEVVPYGFVQVVQHLEGGIVTEISVQEGEIVKKGNVLLRIDDGGAREDLAKVKVKHMNLIMQEESLQALIDGVVPTFSTASIDEVSRQKHAFESILLSREKQKNVIEDQIKQKEGDIEALYSRSRSLEKNLKLAVEAFLMQEKLLKGGYTSRLSSINAEKEKNDIKGKLEENKNKIKQAEEAISEYKNRLSSLKANYRDNDYKELDNVKNKLAQENEIISKLKNRVERLDIKSPVHGVIKGLKINTVGGIINPSETLMEVVPLDENLIAEVQISPSDIGHIKIGQNVRVKVSSFDFSRYGSIDGVLDFVSATTFLDIQNRPYYKGRILLSKAYVGNDSETNIMVPGMTVEADIFTGKKTILSYLLKPIHLSLKTAMSER